VNGIDATLLGMRGVATAVAALAGVLVPAVAAGEVPGPSPPIQAESPALVVRAVPAQAGVRPVQLVFRLLRGRLSCASPTDSLSVGLSSGVRMPATLPSRDVLVDGAAARTAAVDGHVVVLTAGPRAKACGPFAGDAITVSFTDGARLGNPVTPGSYPVWMHAGRLAGTATLLVH
jgi:hypothetical protein